MLYYIQKLRRKTLNQKETLTMASKAELENAIRNDILNDIRALIENKYGTDALQISASEIAIPVLDKEGNEKWAVAKVSIPRGTRNGDGGYNPYDGYAAAEDYKFDLEEKAAKKAASAAKKEAEEKVREKKRADKQQAREAKAALAELKKVKVDMGE